MLIEQFNNQKHNIEEVKYLLVLAVGNPSPDRLAQLLDEFYLQNGHVIFIALQNETVAGLIGIDYSSESYGIIMHLAVRRDIQHQGIGKRLINHIIDELDLKSIEAETDYEAVCFYETCGFTVKEIESLWPGVRRFKGIMHQRNSNP